jgi:hypothetical protein
MKKREWRSQEHKQELQLLEQVLPAQLPVEQLVLQLPVEQPELRLPEALLALGEPQLLEQQQVLLQLVLPAQLILNLNR